ncbi:PREDICTED: charged multivesicular body protein 2a-like [Acropora digitifera]|uniref:charged multivesicular body protein 2a-like n=1 Tax=Acropora digitifera TaxID=70779 RepID=UPI000779FEDD|nr:PREDICTED: charged multivesicular body protein 2a-like [Acropora digitifera]
MEFLFGKKKTPEEMLKQNQRALNRAMRDLDRERQKLEQQEKKVIADIKKMAKAGQMDAVKIMSKDLIRTRKYVKKFIMMRANIQAVSLKVQTLRSNNAMAQAMKGVSKIIKCRCFSIFSANSEKVVQQVLDELGLTLTDELTGLPTTSGTVGVKEGTPKQAVAADADADLQAR